MPSVEMVRLVSSGTEAAMSAIRLARGFTRRDRMLKFAGCYHGHSDGLLASAGSGLATLGIPSSPGVPTGTTARHVVTTFNDLDATAAAVERYGEGLAAIVVEPVAGNMGVVPPAPGFLEALRALCDASGALLVFDEVITGFRVARGGAQERYGVYPDLTILGKIVGGGLPAAAFGGRADVMERLAPAGDVYQAGTLSGNPLATAAGISVLRRLRDAARLRAAGGEGRAARGRAGAVRPRAARRRDGDALPRRRGDPQLRGREDERHRALRRPLPPPARARDLRRAVAVRVPVRLARPLRRRHRPDGRGRWRVLRRLISGRRSPRRLRPRARSGARRCAPSRSASGIFGPLAPERFALGLETIYEGYLVHYGQPRLFEPGDGETALLLGDYLYAHGLVRIAATGELDAVVVLAELISTCAHLRAEQADGDGEAWVDAVAQSRRRPRLRRRRAGARRAREPLGKLAPVTAWLVANAAEEGRNVILGMLVTGLVFVLVIALGETSRALRHRRKH